jgi:hypothetical protein
MTSPVAILKAELAMRRPSPTPCACAKSDYAMLKFRTGQLRKMDARRALENTRSS